VPSEVIGQASAAGQRDAGDDAADVSVSDEGLTSQAVAGCVLHRDCTNHAVFFEIDLAEPARMGTAIRDELEAA
jgi:hypothetical protein